MGVFFDRPATVFAQKQPIGCLSINSDLQCKSHKFLGQIAQLPEQIALS
jgi:hypothetical protein